MLEAGSVGGCMSKHDLLFRHAEDQFIAQNRDRDSATCSWLNLSILCLAFSLYSFGIILQDVLSFFTQAHASIHFTSINISLLIKDSVQTAQLPVILPVINALQRSVFLPCFLCQVM